MAAAVATLLAAQRSRIIWRSVAVQAQSRLCMNHNNPAELQSTSDKGGKEEGGKKTLTLIRHGESEYNYWRRASFLQLQFREMVKQDPGFTDSPLTDTGIKQAEELAANWDVNQRIKCNLVITSPLSRAIDTALKLFVPPPIAPPSEASSESAQPQSSSFLTTTSSLDASTSSDQITPKSSPVKIVVTPLITEQLDVLGDTGLPLDALELKYKQNSYVLDWNVWRQHDMWDRHVWWYTKGEMGSIQSMYRYVAPEPTTEVERRAKEFEDFLISRPEDHICIVGHSLFFKAWTRDTKMENCETRHYDLQINGRKMIRRDLV